MRDLNFLLMHQRSDERPDGRLHVDGGVNVIDTPPSLRQLDLASWARDFTQLKDFTFISTAYFDSTGSFDELAGVSSVTAKPVRQ